MEKFTAVLTSQNFKNLLKIVDDAALLMDNVVTPTEEIQKGSLVRLELFPYEISALLNKIDSKCNVPSDDYSQCDVSELYLNVSYAWECYEDSKGLSAYR